MVDSPGFFVIQEYIVPAAVAMVAVIIGLWNEVRKDLKHTKQWAERCEEKHEETRGKVVELTEKVGRVEGRIEGVEWMANKVIEEVLEGKK